MSDEAKKLAERIQPHLWSVRYALRQGKIREAMETLDKISAIAYEATTIHRRVKLCSHGRYYCTECGGMFASRP